MDLRQYQVEAERTNAKLGTEYKYLTELHMLMGMATEVGELIDVFKKNLAYGKDIDWVNVGEEVADIQWYIVNFCNGAKIDLEKELSKNIDKLKARFPDNFSAEKALNRNLGKEREILES